MMPSHTVCAACWTSWLSQTDTIFVCEGGRGGAGGRLGPWREHLIVQGGKTGLNRELRVLDLQIITNR